MFKTENSMYNHTINGNYECQCGFKTSDLEESKDHDKAHRFEEVARENTQGLIRKDLLLEIVN